MVRFSTFVFTLLCVTCAQQAVNCDMLGNTSGTLKFAMLACFAAGYLFSNLMDYFSDRTLR